MGILVDVNLNETLQGTYLKIVVEAQPFPVNYKGQYHYRSGSIKQELKGSALDKFMFENAVKSQLYIAYLLLELIKRTIDKTSKAFSNLTEKIRFCLYHYLTLDYVCNQIKEGAKKISIKSQMEIPFKQDLFSG